MASFFGVTFLKFPQKKADIPRHDYSYLFLPQSLHFSLYQQNYYLLPPPKKKKKTKRIGECSFVPVEFSHFSVFSKSRRLIFHFGWQNVMRGAKFGGINDCQGRINVCRFLACGIRTDVLELKLTRLETVANSTEIN